MVSHSYVQISFIGTNFMERVDRNTAHATGHLSPTRSSNPAKSHLDLHPQSSATCSGHQWQSDCYSRNPTAKTTMGRVDPLAPVKQSGHLCEGVGYLIYIGDTKRHLINDDFISSLSGSELTVSSCVLWYNNEGGSSTFFPTIVQWMLRMGLYTLMRRSCWRQLLSSVKRRLTAAAAVTHFALNTTQSMLSQPVQLSWESNHVNTNQLYNNVGLFRLMLLHYLR